MSKFYKEDTQDDAILSKINDYEQALCGYAVANPKTILQDLLGFDASKMQIALWRELMHTCNNEAKSGILYDPVSLGIKINNPMLSMGVLDNLKNSVFSPNVKLWISILNNYYLRLDLLSKTNDVQADINNLSIDIESTIINLAQLAKNAMPKPKEELEFIDTKEGAKQFFQKLEDTIENRKNGIMYTGLETGIKSIDDFTCGLQRQDLIILAARPSMGKTCLALNMAQGIASKGKKTLFFSLEMPAVKLVNRMMASTANIPLDKFRTGELSDDEWQHLTMACHNIKDMPLFMVEASNPNPIQIRQKIIRFIELYGGIDAIFIDYLTKIKPDKEMQNMNHSIGSITNELKEIAKEYNLPIVVLSQLNRTLENRANKRPIMQDLRESGEIEQDADVILFIYRDEFYHPDSQDKGKAELICAKHRDGETGTIPLEFKAKYSRFTDIKTFD